MKPLRLVLLLGLLSCKEPAAPTPSIPAPPPASAMPDWKNAFKYQPRFDATASEVVIDVTVAPGFHAYTVGETVGKPMALELPEDGAWALDGEVIYPAGTIKDLPIGKSVIVEGTASVKGKVKAKADPKAEVKGTFRYQVCNDEACDRPRTEPFTLPPA